MPVAPHPTCGQGHTPVGPVNNWPKWHDWKVPTPFKPHESLAGTSGSHRAGLLLTPFQQLSSRLFVPLPSRGSVCSFASSTSPDRLLLFSTSSGGLLLLVTAASPFLSPILLFSLLCQSICSAFPRHLSSGSTTLLSCRSHQFLEISVSRLRLRLRRQLLPLLLPSLLLSRSASIPSTANPLRASGFLLYSSRRISYQLLVIRVRKLSLTSTERTRCFFGCWKASTWLPNTLLHYIATLHCSEELLALYVAVENLVRECVEDLAGICTLQLRASSFRTLLPCSHRQDCTGTVYNSQHQREILLDYMSQ